MLSNLSPNRKLKKVGTLRNPLGVLLLTCEGFRSLGCVNQYMRRLNLCIWLGQLSFRTVQLGL
jgi:hypothetical protein